MKSIHLSKPGIVLLALLLIIGFGQPTAYAGSAAKIDQKIKVGLADLYAGSPTALEFSKLPRVFWCFRMW